MTSFASERPWLVTGAAGFLGSYVVEQLLHRRMHVIALDNLHWGALTHLQAHLANPYLQMVTADIRDSTVITKVLQHFCPDAVVHLAALHYIPDAMAEPALTVSINVHGTQTLLAAASKAAVKRFWFASTGDVYKPLKTPHHEESPLEPWNIYGLSKLQGEQLVALTARYWPTMHFVVGRLFNLYGSRETHCHILPEIIRQLRQQPEKPLRLGNLWPRRDLIPVSDAARAVIETLQCAPAGVTTINVAAGVAWSISEIIVLLGELLGQPLSVQTDSTKLRPVDRPHLQADVTQLHKLLGWTPDTDLRQGLTALLKAEGLL